MLISVWDMFVQAWTQIRAHLGRSLLTALGIIISITGVIAITGVMQGLELMVNRQLTSLGSELVMVQSAGSTKLVRREWDALSSQVPGIKSLVASQQIALRHNVAGDEIAVRYGKLRKNVSVASASMLLPQLYQVLPLQGRFILMSDEAAHHRVCVISEDLIAALGLPQNPLGVKLGFAHFSLEIVGVLPPVKKAGPRQLAQMYIPFGLAQELENNTRTLSFAFTLKDSNQHQSVIRQVRQVLRTSLARAPNEQDGFTIQDAGQLRAANDEIIQMISIVLILLVSISMLVGAIGIMNVMLVAVTQRTREIGVLRALGATKWHIRLQFLIEASSISGLGAMVGLVLGVSLANIFVKLTFEDVNRIVLPLWPMLSAVGVALLVGVLAGAWPAMRAAQLDPIEALAAE